jgi:hypothetical protein
MHSFLAWVGGLVCACACWVFPAVAQAASDSGTNHDGQFGLRVGVAVPFKVNFRYNDSPPCDVSSTGEPKNVCPVSSPVALDFALSYGLTDSLEPFVWYRLGLSDEEYTNTKAVSILGAGLRIYTSTNAFKFFLQPAVAAELEGPILGTLGLNYGTDFIAQLQVGGHFDFMRFVGAYVALGPSVSILRALSLGIEGTLGVQGRFP